MAWSPGGQLQPAAPVTSLRPILKPGAPKSAIVFIDPNSLNHLAPSHVAGFFGLFGGFVAGILLIPAAPLVGVAAMAASAGAGIVAWYRAARKWGDEVVCRPSWSFRGVPITGDAFKMLEEIDKRFAFAERWIEEIPTGIVWADIAHEVQILLWEAAEHAARVSALDVELDQLRYAEANTPQGDLLRTLRRRRAEHFDMLIDIKFEAEDFARVAGNALAAAKVALAATGDLSHLNVAVPSGEAMVAAAHLRDAKARLNLLADVWAELSEVQGIALASSPRDSGSTVDPESRGQRRQRG